MQSIKRRSQRRAPLAAVAILLAAGCGSLEDFPDPASVYQATFNAAPGPGITILAAEGRAFRDSSTCYLRLRASPPAFTGLTATGFTPISREEFLTEYRGGRLVGPLPPWWNPMRDSPTVFLRSGAFHPGFSSGEAIATYDPASQILNFYWDGVD